VDYIPSPFLAIQSFADDYLGYPLQTGEDDMTQGPIYIGGVSYSGKTQLRLLLSRLPNILVTRRTYLWRKFYQKYGDLNEKENFERCLAEILRYKHIQQLNPDQDRIREEFWSGEHSYSRLFALFHLHYAESLGKSRWGIQIGMVEREADLIFSVEPEAKIIQVVRNPIDRVEESMASSSRKRLSIGWETSLWRESTRLAIQNLQKYPKQYMTMKWENLLSDVDGTLQSICEFLGEIYQPEFLKMSGLEEMGLVEKRNSSSNHRQLAKKDALNDYQLSKNEREFIQSIAGKEMAYLGYEINKTSRPLLEKIRYISIDYPSYILGAYIRKSLKLLKT